MTKKPNAVTPGVLLGDVLVVPVQAPGVDVNAGDPRFSGADSIKEILLCPAAIGKGTVIGLEAEDDRRSRIWACNHGAPQLTVFVIVISLGFRV